MTKPQYRITATPSADEINFQLSQIAERFDQTKVGSFTMAAAASKTVSDPGVTDSSIILIFPTNAAGASLMAGVSSLYLSAKTNKASFTVATANGGNAAGTETFNYLIIS